MMNLFFGLRSWLLEKNLSLVLEFAHLEVVTLHVGFLLKLVKYFRADHCH